jgi:outer membrane protein insertion porin family
VSIYYYGLKRYDKDKFIRKKEKVEKKFDAKIARANSTKKINNLQFRKLKKLGRLDSFIENGNMWMQWGEPIAVYDSALVKTTIERFTNYLFTEGYFLNSVTTKITTPLGKRFVRVTYRVDPGPAYTIDTLIYNIPDLTLLKVIQDDRKNSNIQMGDRYSEEKLTSERERLDLMLKDNGYYDFSRQYIEWRVDTTSQENREVALMLIIHNPAKRKWHSCSSFTTLQNAGITNSFRLTQ